VRSDRLPAHGTRSPHASPRGVVRKGTGACGFEASQKAPKTKRSKASACRFPSLRCIVLIEFERARPRPQRVWYSSLRGTAHQYSKDNRDEEERGHISQQMAAFPCVAKGLSRHDSSMHDARPYGEPDNAP